MNAHSQIKAADRLAAWVSTIPWTECVTLARANHDLAPTYIESIHAEALKLAGMGYDKIQNMAIVRECQNYLDSYADFIPEDHAEYLDAIDALIVEDEPEVAPRESFGMHHPDSPYYRGRI